MRPSQLEAWALSIADRARNGTRLEDNRVELKAAFIEPSKAARQLAAHANASRGEPVLWVIGIDEETGLVGVQSPELANWLPQVASYFDGVAPSFVHLAIPYQGVELVALLATTERAPFVVKNPEFGRTQTPIALEVPWREGNRVRSAVREELLRMLIPQVALPTCEWHFAKVQMNGGPVPPVRFGIEGRIYIVPPTEERSVFPFHQCTGDVRIPTLDQVAPITGVSMSPRYARGVEARTLSKTIESSDTELLVSGPGMVMLSADAVLAVQMPDSVLSVTLILELAPALSEAVARLEVTLPIDPPGSTSSDHWTYQRAPRRSAA